MTRRKSETEKVGTIARYLLRMRFRGGKNDLLAGTDAYKKLSLNVH
jgi:hypothetical protein